jgi:hypothetical protein
VDPLGCIIIPATIRTEKQPSTSLSPAQHSTGREGVLAKVVYSTVREGVFAKVKYTQKVGSGC